MDDEDDDFWLILLLLVGVGFLATCSWKPPEVAVPAHAKAPTISNEETWDWVDYRGRKRTITIKRDVKINDA